MKRLLIFTLTVIVSASTFAQKIKINGKTGTVSLDNIAVAHLNTSKGINNQYIFNFRDLNSNDSVTIEIIQTDKPENDFLNVSSNLSDKTSEMDYEMINFTLNINSVIANLITNKYNFFVTSGINKEAILNFLGREDHTRQQALDKQRAKEQTQQAKIASYSPIIKKNTVYNNTTSDTLAYFVKAKGRITGIAIKDIHNNDLATLITDEVDRSPVYSLKTFDNKNFVLTKKGKTDIRLTAINTLIANNYMGNDSNSYNIRKPIFDQEMIALAQKKAIDQIEDHKRSIVKGILTLNNGNIVEGIFKVKFRQTPEGILSTAHNGNKFIDPDPDNEKLSVDYYGTNKNNEERIKTYKASNIKSVLVIDPERADTTEQYIKISYIVEPIQPKQVPILASDGSIDLFGAGKSYIDAQLWETTKKELAYVAAENKQIKLYFWYQKIIITDKVNDRTVLLNPQSFDKQLAVIARNHPMILRDINKGMYQYTRQSMLNFMTNLDKIKQ